MDTSDLRKAWSAYECKPAKYAAVAFPGLNRIWWLWVAAPSVPIWEAAATIMGEEKYLFLESAGGTYNCRPPSVHANGVALDLNPRKNPYQCPLKHNYPPEFLRRMKSIRANGKPALTWGGDWPCSNPPDPMHWQLNVAPADCKNITYDGQQGGSMGWLPLQLGDTSEDVKYLQTKLIILGFLPRTNPPANHGTYDDATAAAVLAMRKAQGSRATSGNVFNADAAQQLDTYWAKFYDTSSGGVTLKQVDDKIAAHAKQGTAHGHKHDIATTGVPIT